MKYLAILVSAVAFVVGTCEAPAKQQPVPNSVALVGDSILWQAILYGQDEMANNAESDQLTYPGWEPKHAQPRLTQLVADPARSPETVVIAFGQNMADRYGAHERAELFSLIYTASDSSCVVLIKPHPAIPGTAAANLNAVRTDMEAAASTRPNTFVMDWSNTVYSHPEYLALDNVHINVPEDWFAWSAAPYAVPAAQAYLNLVKQGISECQQTP